MKSMTTLMSPGRCSKASEKSASGTRRVIRRDSQLPSAREGPGTVTTVDSARNRGDRSAAVCAGHRHGEVDAQAELRGVLDEVVVAVPVARRVRARVARPEARALPARAGLQPVALQARDLLVRQRRALGDGLPEHRHAHDLDTERLHRHQRTRTRGVRAVDQLVVVHLHKQLGRLRRAGQAARRAHARDDARRRWVHRAPAQVQRITIRR